MVSVRVGCLPEADVREGVWKTRKFGGSNEEKRKRSVLKDLS
jgi:hypothetical protein